MQAVDWDHFRFLLALYRAGTLAGAARSLGVNETTVGRRLKTLEDRLAAPLFVRDATGRHQATEFTQRLIGHIEAMESESLAIAEAGGQVSAALAGTVRISAVPFVVNRILVPHLGQLQRLHPSLTVELVPESRNVDLTRREADIAIRLARPTSGGHHVKAQRIGTLRFALFGPASGAAESIWIGYDDEHASLPQAKWLRDAMNSGRSLLRVADVETALEAVAHGLGITLLPVLAAATDPRLCEIADGGGMPPPSRPVWLLWHENKTPGRAASAVRNWLSGLPWKAAAQ